MTHSYAQAKKYNVQPMETNDSWPANGSAHFGSLSFDTAMDAW